MNKSTYWVSSKTVVYSFAGGKDAARCDCTARTDAIFRPADVKDIGGAFLFVQFRHEGQDVR
jgi:hypothetical protein